MIKLIVMGVDNDVSPQYNCVSEL